MGEKEGFTHTGKCICIQHLEEKRAKITRITALVLERQTINVPNLRESKNSTRSRGVGSDEMKSPDEGDKLSADT